MEDLTQLDALEAFVKGVMPGSTVALLNLPEVPVSDLIVILNPVPNERTINGMHTEIITQWRILYLHSHAAKAVEGMNKLRKAFVQGITIPYTDTAGQMWFIRVRAFAPGEMNENESDLNYILAVLETAVKGIRSVEQYETMQEYNVNFVFKNGI